VTGVSTIRATGVEIPLPPQRLRHMRDTDEKFVAHGEQLARFCYRLGLRDGDEILDVGCSVGRLAVGLLTGTDFAGRYVGFDVIASHVRWARRHLTPLAPDYHFRHADVANDRYNPDGKVAPEDLVFPARTGGFHFAVLFSVFTHFYASDIQVYLGELERVLRPGGHVLTSWFLYDDETYERASTISAYPMTHRLDDNAIYNDADDPLRAIAFHEDKVRAWIAAAGFEVVTIEHGLWNGGPGPEFQDHILLRKPAPPAEASSKARDAARQVRRGLGRVRRAVSDRGTSS
jgi:SAM-dependent methyltransferase